MGGNLFKLGRIPREDYLALEANHREYLDRKFGELYRIPRYYSTKPDFGDMDIVLSSQAIVPDWNTLKEELIRDLKLNRYKSTGAVFSTVYRHFQVDYFVRQHENFISTYNFLSFNDVGNLVGRIFRRLNLKYGETGLSYVFRREEGHYKKDLSITRDPKQIFKFLQLDYDKWLAGFDRLEEVFEWVIASPYFSVAPYEKLSGDLEKRARQRTSIQKFLDYLADHRIDRRYQFEEDRDTYLPLIDGFFPEARLMAQLDEERNKEQQAIAIAEKFNGKLVMDLIPDLSGPRLGSFITDFRARWDDPDSALAEMSAEQVCREVLEFYSGWESG